MNGQMCYRYFRRCVWVEISSRTGESKGPLPEEAGGQQNIWLENSQSHQFSCRLAPTRPQWLASMVSDTMFAVPVATLSAATKPHRARDPTTPTSTKAIELSEQPFLALTLAGLDRPLV